MPPLYLAALVHLLSAVVATAATRHVDDNAADDPGPGDVTIGDPLEDGTADHPFDSIQEAIDAAVSGVDDVVVLAGTYRGPGNVNVDFKGKAIEVRAQDGPATTIVDCENAAQTRGFVFATKEQQTSVLRGFTIKNGNMQGVEPARRGGGAVYCQGARPVIRDCHFESNAAAEGGAIGGAICEMLLVRCQFRGNHASGDGGAIYMKNAAYTTIVNGILIDNEAGGSGGAIYHESCSFGDGPGPLVINTLIAGNIAGGDGGGLASIDVCPTRVTHGTVTGNSAAAGGGLIHDTSSQLAVSMSIFWNNAPSGLDSLGDPHIAQVLFSDVQDGVAGDGNINADPLFVDAAAGNYSLSAGSPCIDAGNIDQFVFDAGDLDEDGDFGEALPVDLAELPRIVGTAPDMGAFEAEGTAVPVVSTWGLVVMVLVTLSAGSAAARGTCRQRQQRLPSVNDRHEARDL